MIHDAIVSLRASLAETDLTATVAREQGDHETEARHELEVDRLRAALRCLGEAGYPPLSGPWDGVQAAAGRLLGEGAGNLADVTKALERSLAALHAPDCGAATDPVAVESTGALLEAVRDMLESLRGAGAGGGGWAFVTEVARRLQETYAPGDDRQPARGDLSMLVDALTSCLFELDELDRQRTDPTAVDAVKALLGAVRTILVGIRGDLRDLAEVAEDLGAESWVPGESLAAHLARLHGPVPAARGGGG